MMKHILSYAKLKILIETNKHYNPSFKELKTLLQTTDGNLASFTRQLQNQRLIKKHKRFKNQKPYTQYSITPLGIFALQENKQFLTELLEELK